MRLLPKSFLDEEDGLSLTEALLTFPIVMLVFAAFVEFGYAMFQWNQTSKAMQLGARVVAVSDWMVSDDDVDALFPAVAATLVGSSIPADGESRSCSTDNLDPECSAGLNRLVNGSGRWPGLKQFNPRIGTQNVIVTYTRTGLGYYGRPDGAVVTIRLESRNIGFDLPILGSLLGLQGNIVLPPLAVTLTSEDLRSSPPA